MPGLGGYFVNALRGLICVRLGRCVRICNLTTKQLLSTFWKGGKGEGIMRSEHQMLVLGPGAYWRNTYNISTHPHRPYSQGIFINGVLYYGAWIYKNTCVVISFDFAYVEFDLIELPVEAGIVWHKYCATLINYGGKLAVLEYSKLSSNASVDLWVMESAEDMKWSNKNLVLPLSQMNFLHGDKLEIQCMSRCGKIRLLKTERIWTRTKPSVIYDLEKNKITRNLEVNNFLYLYRDFHTTFWEDDIESIMYLET
ncbi:PREDICTED: putative F-box protein At3g52320 [Camelina sativa]|uniref:F-box protein At3g52320 n=1 Tax=Camelina sativa TaxID=90675 RepID=A0ABM0YXF4_CAMSA|nr:PREDICTED: putative F-box protein At3g52320 [Camelina sativa]